MKTIFKEYFKQPHKTLSFEKHSGGGRFTISNKEEEHTISISDEDLRKMAKIILIELES